MAFDASPSWSGFNYQGKVALYYALSLINTILNTDFSNYALMLEDNEDFEILYNGKPISIHQVKAYNSSAYSKYSDALLEITLELHKQPKVIGRIHTWKQINFQDLKTSIKDDLKDLLDQYDNTNPKDGNSIIEKAVSTDRNKPKKAAILNAAFPKFAAKQLYNVLNDIYNEQSNAINRLDIYQYKDNHRFCDLAEVNEKIKSEISTALKARNITCTSTQLEKTFHYFLGMMDRYIILRHETKQQEEKISITFNEIIQVLGHDHEDIGLEYLAYKFKEQFAYQIDEYISDPEDYIDPEENVLCNLKEASKFLLNLSPTDLWMYYRNFCPHINLAHDNNTTNALATSPDGIRHVLIKILHKINFERASHNASKYNLIYRTTTTPHKSYLPTTITSTPKITQIAKKITSNPNMCETLFEVEHLIYDGPESYRFSPTSMTHTEAPQAKDEDPRTKRDDILKNITLVPIATAKEALN